MNFCWSEGARGTASGARHGKAGRVQFVNSNLKAGLHSEEELLPLLRRS